MPHVDWSCLTKLHIDIIWSVSSCNYSKIVRHCKAWQNSPGARKPEPQYWWAMQGRNRWTWWGRGNSSGGGSPEPPRSSWGQSSRAVRAWCSWPTAMFPPKTEKAERRSRSAGGHWERGGGGRRGEAAEQWWWKREIIQTETRGRREAGWRLKAADTLMLLLFRNYIRECFMKSTHVDVLPIFLVCSSEHPTQHHLLLPRNHDKNLLWQRSSMRNSIYIKLLEKQNKTWVIMSKRSNRTQMWNVLK